MITVFTPTYNRSETLPLLYNSLISQSFQGFEWLIVDDGSTDATEMLVHNWIEEKKILIRYYKQKNGGKHRAINKGVDLAHKELFFIVDSDDFLPSSSLEIIVEKSKMLDDKIIGLAGRRQYFNREIVGSCFPKKEFVSDSVERIYLYSIKGDLAEVYKTAILRKYKFPDFKGELFCAEGLIWNRIAAEYKLLFFDTPIYFCEYIEGGLSANSIKNRRKSPTYAMQLYSELVQDKRIPLWLKMRTYINFWRFSFFSSLPFIEKWKKIDRNFIGLLMYPIGWILKLKDDRVSVVKINK